MKVIFAGTPDFAARALATILASRHTVQLVLTQPDRPAGRGMHSLPSAVKQIATSNGLPLRQPASLRDPVEQQVLAAVGADVLVVAAYGLILPQAVLDIPRLGAFNIHASLLPRWRGAAPIQRALMSGDAKTGISIMRMDAGLDTGGVCLREETEIREDDDAQTLHDRLADMGARIIVQALDLLEAGPIQAVPQPDSGITYAHKIAKSEARIDWSQSAVDIWRQIRAFSPSPGATGRYHDTELKICKAHPASDRTGDPGQVLQADPEGGLLVACGSGGALWLDQLQKPGGKKLSSSEFLRGFRMTGGESFTW